MTSAEDKARKGVVQLLQFLMPGPALRLDDPARTETGAAKRARMAAGGGGAVVLVSAKGREQAFPAALLAICARQGLIVLEAKTCHSLPPARALLKRLIVGAEFGFAGQHGQLVGEERMVGDARAHVLVNQDSSPLSSLTRLKERDGSAYFPPTALHAGERLLADFTFGGLQPRITSSWQPRLETGRSGGAGGGAALSDHAADARSRVSRAAAALGPELSGVALDICCFSKGLELVERERQWPARSAKLMLRTALLGLARHYGLQER